MSFLAYTSASDAKPYLRFVFLMAGLAVLPHLWGQKYITTPRLGRRIGPTARNAS
jgi:hypothetical protein